MRLWQPISCARIKGLGTFATGVVAACFGALSQYNDSSNSWCRAWGRGSLFRSLCAGVSGSFRSTVAIPNCAGAGLAGSGQIQ